MKYILILISLILGNITIVFSQTLEEYFKIAEENNPGLQAKYKEFEASQQKIHIANSLPDPNFTFGYFISPVETRFGPQLARFSLQQMFPWFGTIEIKEEIASLNSEAMYFTYLEHKNNLLYQVATIYYSLLELNQLEQIEKDNLQILKLYKDIAINKYENGNAPATDYLRVEIMINDASSNLKIISDKIKALDVKFNTLLNRDIDVKVVINDSIPFEVIHENDDIDSMISNNPIIKDLNVKTRISESNQILVTKQGLPDFKIGVDYIVVGKRTDINTPENGRDIFMPTVSVSIPIFRKKYKAASEEARLYQESNTLQVKEFENSLYSNYTLTKFEINKQIELIRLYDTQIKKTKEILESLLSEYRNSGKDFVEILRLQQEILKYQKLKANAISLYYSAYSKANYLTAKQY